MHTADRRVSPRRDALAATVIYAALTIVFTWPLARGVTRDIVSDFGDPVFETWAIAWDITHFGRGLWNANIFFPHPRTLAYSESFLPQAVQAAPVYWLTRNPILCYNLLFLSTFVLSGLGMFLLAREFTGDRVAAFVAGLAFAFAPYRFGTLPHMQILSSAWMPLTLLAFRRYFVTRRPLCLASAATAWFVQNLSCLYYMLFFTPVIAIYLVWELSIRGLWTDRRVVIAIAAACAVVGLATVPFLLPYVDVRRLGISLRSFEETDRFSADTYAYLTAWPGLRLVGPLMQAWPKPEGLLFPGMTITVLAAVAVVSLFRSVSDTSTTDIKGRMVSDTILSAALLADVAMLVALLFGWTLRLPSFKVTSVSRVLAVGAALAAALLGSSVSARRKTQAGLASPAAFFAIASVFAVVMSFGPHVHAKGRVVADPSFYAVFFNYVPGFDGVRVPARFGMIVTLGFAALAAYGVQTLRRAMGKAAPIAAAALILAESFGAPLPINDSSTGYTRQGLAPPSPTLTLDANERAAYAYIASLAPSAALVELPLGEPSLDVRYMLNSTHHWKPLVNGYSGAEPDDYAFLDQRLRDLDSRPDAAWEALASCGATHAIVHEALYQGDGGTAVSTWLRSHGAREVAAFGRDRIFQLR